MHLRCSLTSLVLLCAGVGALAQTAPTAPTCADLHLVPAPRECVAVQPVSIGLDGLRLLEKIHGRGDAKDGFHAEVLLFAEELGRGDVGHAAVSARAFGQAI